MMQQHLYTIHNSLYLSGVLKCWLINLLNINGKYQLLTKMVRLQIILVLSTIITLTVAPNSKFCSPVCGTRCNANLNSNCANSCPDAAWMVSGNTCAPKTSLGWKLFDSTPDYGGTLTVTGASATTASCGTMKYYGYVNPSTTISVSTPGISVPYFAMKAYVGIIAIDVNCWGGGGNGGGGCGSGPNPLIQSSTYFTITFNNPEGATITNPINTNPISANGNTRADYCGSVNNFREYYFRYAQSYPVYSIQNQTLQWDIFCTETSNTSALWGIREFLIIIQSCNVACLTCYGPAATQCTSCADGYWQSNNTCSLTCLTRFGYALNPNVCVYCDLRCTACYNEMDNCTSCTTSGVWVAYLSTTANALYPTCVNPCTLTNQFANKVTRTCDPCDAVCETCVNRANYCTSCIAGTTYWTGWYCYNPCPVQYFLDPNGTNCTRCSPFCAVCDVVSTNCTECTLSGQFKAYLQNSTALWGNCSRVCSDGYYGQTFGGVGPNICIACDFNCTLCTGFPTPCTACKPGLYLLNSACTDTCPNGTIPSNTTGIAMCLNCDLWCVDLTINMYFSSVVNDKIYVDMTFSQTLNYTTFDQVTFQTITITSKNIQYTTDMFTFTYENLTTSSYRIIIEPKTYIFLYNATFTVQTKAQPSPIDYSVEGMPFKTTNYLKTAALTWFLIKGPPFTKLELGIMNSLSKLSTKTNKLLAQPYVQEIKKTGVFSLLFSGAQATSYSMLSNQIQSQNMYEGVRFFGVFVFFDSPPYEQISDKTKRFVDPTVQDKIRNSQQVPSRRALFSTDTMYWRFQRTGQTSFFIYDVYMPMFLIFLCWVGVVVAYCCTKKRWYVRYASNLYSAVHKIHEVSLMYITMASIVEFIYFQPSSSERIISGIVCIVFNVYFVIYELYIYQDMIRYPMAEIGNKYYDYFVLRYGFFLKNIRFQEYDPKEEWSPSHWFRPYNFHVLSYYKKFLMIIVLPLFYDVQYAQMGLLMFLQFLQMVRMWNVWPFVSKFRNYFRLTLQFSLFMFFMINLIQISVLNNIMTSDTEGLQALTKVFYGIGWTGFAFCMYFNFGHICIGIYDLCTGLKLSNRAKMDNARKKYYCLKINEYEKDNDSSSKELVNRWVKLGNLNDKSYGELPEVNVRIEFYEFKKINNKFELRIKKITSLKMKQELKKLRKPNNTTVGGKIEKDIVLSQSANPRLYGIINDVYKQYEGPHVETIRLKTFLNVWQKDYEEGESIAFDRNLMFQRVELISYDNEVNQTKLQTLLQDFPLDQTIINRAIY